MAEHEKLEQIGYFGVIVPELDFWQGYFLYGGPDLDLQAEKARVAVGEIARKQGVTKQPLATLGGGLAQVATIEDINNLALFSRALSLETEKNYFLVVASKEPEGWSSEITTWDDLEDAEHARLLLTSHPVVKMIEARAEAKRKETSQ